MRNGTVLPNGPLVVALRKARGWSQEELEWQTEIAAEREVAEESAARVKNGLFTRYKQRRHGNRQSLRVARHTISRVENGLPVYAMTLKIIAAALRVEPAQIILSGDRFLPGPPRSGIHAD